MLIIAYPFQSANYDNLGDRGADAYIKSPHGHFENMISYLELLKYLFKYNVVSILNSEEKCVFMGFHMRIVTDRKFYGLMCFEIEN
jgi:hypothetical protein